MSQSFIVTGIVIKRDNFREADKWLTVFSKEKGKIRILAKGLRKITSRRSGRLELFNEVKLQVVAGRSTNIGAEVEVINSFPKFRKNLSKVSLVYQFAEVVHLLTPEEAPRLEVYFLLKDFLEKAEILGQAELQAQLIISESSLLVTLGFWDGVHQKEQFKDLNFIRQFIELILEHKLKAPDVLRA